VDVSTLETSVLTLTGAIILVAISSKFFGSGLGARWGGFSWQESWQLGAGMVSRGEVGLIVADVGIAAGLVATSEFSAIVGMVLVTTIVTPPMLRALFTQPNTPNEEISAAGKEA
jgi:Kef-type K+ transport system membrane component KefB